MWLDDLCLGVLGFRRTEPEYLGGRGTAASFKSLWKKFKPILPTSMRDTGGERRANRRENTQKINTPTKREPSGFYYIFSCPLLGRGVLPLRTLFLRQSFDCFTAVFFASPEELFRLERFHYAEVMLRDFFVFYLCFVLFHETDRPTLSVPSRVVLCLECPVLATSCACLLRGLLEVSKVIPELETPMLSGARGFTICP